MERFGKDEISSNEIYNKTSNNTIWRDSIGIIFWGILLGFFNTNILGLSVILPIISIGLIYSGACLLRYHNSDFKEVYKWLLIYITSRLLLMILIGTEFNENILALIFSGIVTIIYIKFLIELKDAIDNIYKKLDVIPPKSALSKYIIFNTITLIGTFTFLLLIPFIAIPIVIWLIFIFFDLYKYKNILQKLDINVEDRNQIPYVKKNVFIGVITFSLLLTVTLFLSYFSFYNDNVVVNKPNEYVEVKSKLVEDGVSDWLVDMLSDDELILINNYTDIKIFDNYVVGGRISNTENITSERITIQTIYLQQSEGIVYYLQGLNCKEHPINWNSSIFYITGYNNLILDEKFLESSKLFYEKDGKTFERLLSDSLLKEGAIIYNRNKISGPADLMVEFNFPFNSTENKLFVLGKLKFADSQNQLAYVYSTPIVRESPMIYPFKSFKAELESNVNSNNPILLDIITEYFYDWENLKNLTTP